MAKAVASGMPKLKIEEAAARRQARIDSGKGERGVCLCVYMCIFMCMCACVYLCVCTCMIVCVCVCVCEH